MSEFLTNKIRVKTYFVLNFKCDFMVRWAFYCDLRIAKIILEDNFQLAPVASYLIPDPCRVSHDPTFYLTITRLKTMPKSNSFEFSNKSVTDKIFNSIVKIATSVIG